jgi:hypothetical protein
MRIKTVIGPEFFFGVAWLNRSSIGVSESRVQRGWRRLAGLAPVALLLSSLSVVQVVGMDVVLEEVAQYPGTASFGLSDATLAANHRVYAAGTIFDVTNPGDPHSVGSFPGYALSASDDYLFTWTDSGRIQMLDVRNPASPLSLSSYLPDASSFAGKIAVAGSHAYWANPGGLDVLDFSDPANFRHVMRYALPGGPVDVGLSGNFAYVLTEGTWLQKTNLVNSGITVFDIGDPSHPQPVGNYQAHYECKRMAVAGGFAYVGTAGGLRIIDLRDPTNPRQVGSFDQYDSLGVAGVEVSGNTAAVSSGDPIVLLDVADPENPRLLGGSAPLGGYGAEVRGMVGDYVFAAAWHSGLHVLQRRPAALQRLGSLNLSGKPSESKVNRMALAGNYAYLTDPDVGLMVVELEDLSTPRLASLLAGPISNPVDVAISGNHLYVAAQPQGLQVLDVSDAAKPVRVGALDQIGFASAVAVSGNFAYVATNTGVVVADVSKPSTPRRIGQVGTGGSPYSLNISGHYLYVAARNAGLQIMDITTPGAPRLAGGYNSGGYAQAVSVSDTRACLCSEPTDDGSGGLVGGGLDILDVTDPAHPQRLGNYGGAGSFFPSVAVSGGYAYVPSNAGVDVIDISNPATPRRLGGNFVWMAPWGNLLMAGEDVVYAGNGELIILNHYRPFRLESVSTLDRNNFRLRVDGPPGASAQIQRSNDLIRWADWLLINLGGAPLELADPGSATDSRRFYRGIIH